MAFSQPALQAELYSVFSSMTDGDNHRFSKGISDAFKNFVDSGKPQTTNSGSIPTGTFTGASTDGSMTSDSSGCESIIQSACEAMVDGSKDNDYLAEEGRSSDVESMALNGSKHFRKRNYSSSFSATSGYSYFWLCKRRYRLRYLSCRGRTEGLLQCYGGYD